MRFNGDILKKIIKIFKRIVLFFLNNKCETQSLCDKKIIELAKLAQVAADLPIRSADTER